MKQKTLKFIIKEVIKNVELVKKPQYSNEEKIKSIFLVATDAQLAELLITGKLLPVDNLNQSELFDRLSSIHNSFINNPKKFQRALQLYIKLNKKMIKDDEIEELFDENIIDTKTRINAGYIADLATSKTLRDNLSKYKWQLKS
jgi:hypothetical protein